MPPKVIWLLSFFLLLALQPSGRPGNPVDAVLQVYRRADKFFNDPNPTESSDSLALSGFEKVIRLLEKSTGKQTDSLRFQSWLKKGILLDVQSNNNGAKQAYLEAAALPLRNTQLSDSLLFRVYIYVGSNYYNLNDFDSANFFLIKAEKLAEKYPAVQERERLYNTLGALHFANGNYLQSRNYFSQALDLIESKKPYDAIFAQGLQANIASSYYKMGRYPEALGIYKKIIHEKGTAPYIYNGICMNMGKAYQALQQYPEAMASFRKIDPTETPAVWNEIALAHYEQSNNDSAIFYLKRLQNFSAKNSVNILDRGINALYGADLMLQQQEFLPAINQLQQAICAFSSNFNDKDIYANPQSFSGSYTYYRLFEALHSKAAAFETLYQSKPVEKYLKASLDAYMSTMRLLGFIEKSYDTDDAKFFLKKNSRDVYSEALAVCLQLQFRFPHSDYLEKAFQISEKNKASILAASLRQRSINQASGVDSGFLQQERNIKYNIARLDVKSEQAKDNAEIEALAREKAKYEIALSQLQKELEQNSRYFQLKYEDANYSAKDLQSQLDDDQALFNFYSTNDALHVFAFTRNDFKYLRIDAVDSLKKAISEWVLLLQSAGDGRKFDGRQTSGYLYQKLVAPMQSMVGDKGDWVIIPDGSLYLLPFESLPADASGKYLLERATISYQFSSRFLFSKTKTRQKKNYEVLSFAPFVKAGAGMDPLLRSAEEIAGLKGRQYLGKTATKAAFLQQLNKFPILHLATHAIADPKNPGSSFIAFYPEKGSPVEDNLFLEEIYGLDLEDCQLVIVSACETGKGELVSNEGVISLGRAFAAAGCDGTINSLWKADDKATAFILEHFHQYLQKGLSKSRALQKAKLDYIKSDAIYKNPAYWSNLVLLGDDTPVIAKAPSVTGIVLAIFCSVMLLIVYLVPVLKRRRRKKVDAYAIGYASQKF